ncbi:MAG: UDP-glucose/GDP-mannose dehydrogenase family protein, partial [candidate division WOR-3 bacterium]
KTIGILGLAFKPNTDDMRDAPSITVIRALQKAGAVIKAYDPVAIERAKKVMKGIDYCRDPYETADGVDAIILVTEWDEFKKMDLERVRRAMRKPVFIDGRNLFEPEKMKDLGFVYCGIGR